MTDFMVQLTSISEIKQFVNISCMQPYDIYIHSGHYVIDAKSIMAIFSLDLSKPFRVEAECGKAECRGFMEAVKDYIVDDMQS